MEVSAYATIGIGIGFKGNVLGQKVDLTLKGVSAKPFDVTISAESECGNHYAGEMCFTERKSVFLGGSGSLGVTILNVGVTFSARSGLDGAATLKTCVNPANGKGRSELRLTGTASASGSVTIGLGPFPAKEFETPPFSEGWDDEVVWSMNF